MTYITDVWNIQTSTQEKVPSDVSPNIDANQSAYPRSLIRVSVVYIKKLYIHCCPEYAQWKFESDCAIAQANVNLG